LKVDRRFDRNNYGNNPVFLWPNRPLLKGSRVGGAFKLMTGPPTIVLIV